MAEELNYIADNLENVRKRIADAAARSGRSEKDITLIAVTKTVDMDRIRKAVDAGVTDAGENRVQELCKKFDVIGQSVNWHLIGHLQTNKVKYIIDKVKLIHSVDSLELADEIQKRAQKAGKIMDILVQVNVAREDTKSGIYTEEVKDFIRKLSAYGSIRVKGLMTIAPFAENPEEVRAVFRELKKIFIDIREENTDNINMEYLSMGMSNDFEVAIEEGSNMVRVGTAIFGKRQY